MTVSSRQSCKICNTAACIIRRHIHRIELVSKRVRKFESICSICIIYAIPHVRTLTTSNNMIKAFYDRPRKVGNVSQRSCNSITYVLHFPISLKFCKSMINGATC